jgi:hypothetical protein
VQAATLSQLIYSASTLSSRMPGSEERDKLHEEKSTDWGCVHFYEFMKTNMVCSIDNIKSPMHHNNNTQVNYTFYLLFVLK